MTRAEDTELFLRYRDSGDQEARARVFDRVAPKLLLVAAIENASGFGSDQPLLPWLNGILLNRWQQERRRREVRRRHHDSGEPVEALAAPDTEVEATELVAEVTTAIEQLPQPYRSALNLRLVHGLKAVEIAHALGLSPGPVRSQLRRGLALLRRRLPRSLVLPSVVALMSGEGLAAVRERVALAAREVRDGCVDLGRVHRAFDEAAHGRRPGSARCLDRGFDVERRNGRARRCEWRDHVGGVGSEREPAILIGRRSLVEQPGLRVSGRIVDGPTGAPLSGVLARIERVFARGEWQAREAWHSGHGQERR